MKTWEKSRRLDKTTNRNWMMTMMMEGKGGRIAKMSFTERSIASLVLDVWRTVRLRFSSSFKTDNCSCCTTTRASFLRQFFLCNDCCSIRGRGMGSGDSSSISLHFPRSLLSSILTLLAFTIIITSQLNLCSAQKLMQNLYKSHNNPTTSIVIPHIKYGQGLNRWSFLSVDRNNHGLYSDLLCPNPLLTGTGTNSYNRAGSGGPSGTNTGTGARGRQQQPQQHSIPSRFPGQQAAQPLPNEIWAVKTDDAVSQLPCSLRQYSVPSPPFSTSQNSGNNLIMMNTGGGRAGPTRHNNGHFIENRILLMNVSLVPFNFHGAIPCSKYIKMMYDEEEGTKLRCRDIPFDKSHDNNYHINWPETHPKRKDYFSLLENLERFLKNEKMFRRQFYFQIYFTSFNGRSKRCIVQQYELDLSYPAGNSRYCNLTQMASGYEELCGEFHCDDLIFPLYPDPQPHTVHEGGGRHGGRGHGGISEEVDDDEYIYEDEDFIDDELDSRSHHPKLTNEFGRGGWNSLGQTHNSSDNFSWSRMLRFDMRLLIFITIVPLVLFGVLVFGMELIVYFMCCRKRRDEDGEGGDRAQQLLQNSLNVWENVPSRDAQRTVSFSPMTTSIYGERKNMQMMDAASLESHPDCATPKILKSALKKHGEHSSPTAGHHYFEYDHDMPPSYIETTSR